MITNKRRKGTSKMVKLERGFEAHWRAPNKEIPHLSPSVGGRGGESRKRTNGSLRKDGHVVILVKPYISRIRNGLNQKHKRICSTQNRDSQLAHVNSFGRGRDEHNELM